MAGRTKRKPDLIDVGFRVAGSMMYPDGTVDVFTEQVARASGYGRWVYCTYCGRDVRPAVSFPTQAWREEHDLPASEQLICATCGYGLAPPIWLEGACQMRWR